VQLLLPSAALLLLLLLLLLLSSITKLVLQASPGRSLFPPPSNFPPMHYGTSFVYPRLCNQ